SSLIISCENSPKDGKSEKSERTLLSIESSFGLPDFPSSGLIFVTMNIGFDAKMAYHNGTGLGHYSRTLIRSLADHYPEHDYYLFNPKPSSLFQMKARNIHEILPSSFVDRTFSSRWRDRHMKKDLIRCKIDLYHGLDHEIPQELHETGIKSVVTIHDLIYERYPAQFSKQDLNKFTTNYRYACQHANKVIAISEQ